MQTSTKLYVDGLNIATKVGFGDKHWNIKEPRKGVKKFVTAARKSGYDIKVFIDAGIESEEALTKWKMRREDDLVSEKVGVITCMSTLLGELFKENNVEVFYSPHDADCDDCIAYFANKDGADILSEDADFYRYVGRTYKLFGSFEYHEDGIILTERRTVLRPPEPREFLQKEPNMYKVNPVFELAIHTHVLKRGVPSSLVKMVGNVHAHLGNLRAVVYKKIGVKGGVREVWPEWDEKGKVVVWREVLNTPTDIFVASFMTQPSTHFHLITSDMPEPDRERCTAFEISNHRLSVALLICEVYAHFLDKTLLSVFEDDGFFVDLATSAHDAHREDPARLPNACRNWKSTGTCKFGVKCSWSASHFVCDCRRGEYCQFRHE
jgi:hypothetical protein